MTQTTLNENQVLAHVLKCFVCKKELGVGFSKDKLDLVCFCSTLCLESSRKERAKDRLKLYTAMAEFENDPHTIK